MEGNPEIAAIDDVAPAASMSMVPSLKSVALDPGHSIFGLFIDVHARTVALQWRDAAIDGAQLASTQALCKIDRLDCRWIGDDGGCVHDRRGGDARQTEKGEQAAHGNLQGLFCAHAGTAARPRSPAHAVAARPRSAASEARSDKSKLLPLPRQAEISPVHAAFAAMRPGRYRAAAGSPRDEHPAPTFAAAVFEMPLGGCQPLQPARRAATIARDVDSRSAAISDAAAATLVAPAILPVAIVLLQR
jgi:hypothetical protein